MMTDFSQPQRMSIGAFFIIFLKSLKEVFAATSVFLLLKIFQSDSGWLDRSVWLLISGYIGLSLAMSLFVALAKYLPLKFYVRNGSLIFTHGLIRRQTTTIPLDRIHALRTKRGLAYQMLHLRGIAFDTLASKTEEIELILDESDWQSLLGYIELEEKIETSVSDDVPQEGVFIYFRNKYLMADAFCQNHLKGMAVLAAFLLAVFDKISDVIGDVVDYVDAMAYEYADELTLSPLQILSFLAAAYIIVMILWVGKALLLYYDMTVAIDKKLLTFSRGLFSRMSNRFSYDKVCTVCVKQNFLERKFRLCTLLLKQAMFATAKKEEDNIKIYSSEASLILLKWWLGEEYEAQPTVATAKSGKGVFFLSILPGVVLSVVVAVILCYCQFYVWTIIPALCLPIVLYKGACAMRKSRIALKESYILVGNGKFADVRNYIKYDNVEVVRIKRSPLTRWFHRVSLIISTSGSSFTIRSLHENYAYFIADAILSKVALADCRYANDSSQDIEQ